LHLTPTSSLHLLISENDGDDDNDDDDGDDDDAADDDDVDDDDVDDDDDPDDLFPMAKMAPKKRGAAAVGKKAAPKKKTTGEETIDLDTPQGRSRAPPPRAIRSRRGAATPSTPTPTARRTRLTSCSTRAACPPRMPSPRSPSYLEGRH
jgi:hypothetical protein